MLRGRGGRKTTLNHLLKKKMLNTLIKLRGQNSGTTTVVIVQREQPSAQVVPNARQAPPVNEEKALVLDISKEKSSEEDTSKNEIDDEPPTKKLKFLIPPSLIPSPTPLKSIIPKPLKVTEVSKMTLDQFTEHLSKNQLIHILSYSSKSTNTLQRFRQKKRVGPLSQEEFDAQIKEMKRLADLKAKKEKSKQKLKKMFN
nr:hypothetical protein [Tanacetum cinerariifolium]